MTDSENVVVDGKPSYGSDRDSGQGRPRPPSDCENTATKSNTVLSPHEHTVEIRSATILKVLAYCILTVITLHLMLMVSWFGFGHDYLKGLGPMFNLNGESNIPTFFSALQLFFAAILLGVCAARHKSIQGKYFKHWAGLSVIFVYLAFDEAALIHENIFSMTRYILGVGGLLYYAWVIPFGVFALIVLLTYSRFLLSLPGRTGLIFFLSGAVFVTGAIGVELFEGRIDEAGGFENFEYLALVTVEEILEITGIYAFIYGLLGYLTAEGHPFKMSLVK